MIDKIRALLKKFWQSSLTADESNELRSLLESHEPELRKDLQKQFYNSIAEKEIRDSSSTTKHRGKVITLIRKPHWWVAASLIIAIAGFYMFNSRTSEKPAEVAMIQDGKSIDTSSSAVVTNTSASNEVIVLSDGSQVSLAPGSSISYKKHFDENKRNITLSGKAGFKVSKDKKRPFTVYTDDFATTALGTWFEVNTFTPDNIVVRLFEGKVMIHSTNHAESFRSIYLTPGQSVSVNTLDRTAIVSLFIKEDATKNIPKRSKTDAEEQHRLVFENESLKNVFEKLSVEYNTRIQFNAKQVEGLYFTGYTLESDNIKNILTLIAGMNGFKTRDMGEYILIHK